MRTRDVLESRQSYSSFLRNRKHPALESLHGPINDPCSQRKCLHYLGPGTENSYRYLSLCFNVSSNMKPLPRLLLAPSLPTRREIVVTRCLVAVLLVGTMSGLWAAYGQDKSLVSPPKVRAVVSGEDAFLPGPVQMVVPAQTEEVVAHPQGRYALIVQKETALPPGSAIEPLTGTTSLHLYDSRTGKTKLLWEQSVGKGIESASVDSIQWLPGTDCAVIVTRVRPTDSTIQTPTGEIEYPDRSTLLFFDFSKNLSGRTLFSGPRLLRVNVSPLKPIAVVEILSGPSGEEDGLGLNQARFITARGTFGASRRSQGSSSQGGWSPDGTRAYGYLVIPTKQPDGKIKSTIQWFEWNSETGVETPLPEHPKRRASPPEPQAPLLNLGTGGSLLIPALDKSETGETLRPLYMVSPNAVPETPHRSLILAPDVDPGKYNVLPDNSAVLYQVKGALYAIPLVHLKATAFAEAQKAIARHTVLTRAKQAGLAILMYTQDYDDVMPLKERFATIVLPYLKDKDGLNGFTYLGGGDMKAVQSPSTTPLGYLTVSGGRVVVYVDGHVVWEDGK